MRQVRVPMLRTRRPFHRLCVLMAIFICTLLLLRAYHRHALSHTQLRRHENLYNVQHRLYLDREAAKISLETICRTIEPNWTDKFLTISLSAPPNVTVVTAFFDLGKFQKGGGRIFFEPDLYRNWSDTYRYMQNPLVVFTDSPAFEELFLDIRQDMLDITRVEMVNRSSIWAFNYVGKVKSILSIKGYPRHPPNTVMPEYACAQHAKYWALQQTVERNYFNTTYLTWLDVGYFRYIIHRKRKFVIVPPPAFEEDKIAVNKISFNINFDTPVRHVFYGNTVWVGGGMLFGTRRTMPAFIKDYKRAVERYLAMNLTNTDQQVLLAMNLKQEKPVLNAAVKLQTYQFHFKGDRWFFLGYICYREITQDE